MWQIVFVCLFLHGLDWVRSQGCHLQLFLPTEISAGEEVMGTAQMYSSFCRLPLCPILAFKHVGARCSHKTLLRSPTHAFHANTWLPQFICLIVLLLSPHCFSTTRDASGQIRQKEWSRALNWRNSKLWLPHKRPQVVMQGTWTHHFLHLWLKCYHSIISFYLVSSSITSNPNAYFLLTNLWACSVAWHPLRNL